MLCLILQAHSLKKKYQIHLKSHSGPIYVLLVNKDTDSSSPVVVQVPPPKEEPGILETTGQTDMENPPAKRIKVWNLGCCELGFDSSLLFFLVFVSFL